MAAFQAYSLIEAPKIFLKLLERELSATVTKEMKKKLVDIVQKCHGVVYRQYLAREYS
jgi:hypothetical protein